MSSILSQSNASDGEINGCLSVTDLELVSVDIASGLLPMNITVIRDKRWSIVLAEKFLRTLCARTINQYMPQNLGQQINHLSLSGLKLVRVVAPRHACRLTNTYPLLPPARFVIRDAQRVILNHAIHKNDVLLGIDAGYSLLPYATMLFTHFDADEIYLLGTVIEISTVGFPKMFIPKMIRNPETFDWSIVMVEECIDFTSGYALIFSMRYPT